MREAPAVQPHVERVEPEGLRRARAEAVDIVGPGQIFGHHRTGVMIALQQIDRDAGLLQPAHRAREIQARPHVAPVAVEQVAGDDDEVHRLFAGTMDQIVEGGTVAFRTSSTGNPS